MELLDQHLEVHLHPAEMSRLVRLDCTHELAFEWLAHLVSCRVCRQRLVRSFPSKSRRILDRFLMLQDASDPTISIHPRAYDKVLERVQTRGLAELSTQTRVSERRAEGRPRRGELPYSITRSS